MRGTAVLTHIARLLHPGDADPPPGVGLRDAVTQARVDYQVAQAYFQTVSEVELVDQAIHLVAASEKRLRYLLCLARESDGPSGTTP